MPTRVHRLRPELLTRPTGQVWSGDIHRAARPGLQRSIVGGTTLKPSELVDEYMLGVSSALQPALARLRRECQQALVGFEEALMYGGPVYPRRNGVAEVGFAERKPYISLYISRTDVMAKHRQDLAGRSVGTGCIRYTWAAQIDFPTVRSMLAATAASKGPVC